MARRTPLVLCVLAAVLLTGCQRTLVNESLDMSPGDTKYKFISAPSGEQQVVVEISSSAASLDVWIVLGSESDLFGKRPDRDPARVVTSRKKIRSETIEATIPAGKEYAVILTGVRAKTEVKLEVTGR